MPSPKTQPNVGNQTPKYFFEAKEGGLTFNLSLDLQKSGARTSFLELVDVSDIPSLRPTISVDYTENTICIKFGKLDAFSKANLGKIIHFIEKIKEYGICEQHENQNALWFYGANTGDEILNTKNYPIALQDHLYKEKLKYSKIVSSAKLHQKYSVIVEVGCGANLVNHFVATENNLPYLGVEFSAHAAREATMRAAKAQLPQVTIKCENILNLSPERLDLTLEMRPLFIFPFNLVGNIAPISLLFSKLKFYGYDFVASIYRLDEAAKQLRLEYYTNCGYKNIKCIEDERGMTFTSDDGLYTVAYNREYLKGLLVSLGFSVSFSDCSKYGTMIHARAKPWQPAAKNAQVESKNAAPLLASAPPPLALPASALSQSSLSPLSKGESRSQAAVLNDYQRYSRRKPRSSPSLTPKISPALSQRIDRH